MQLNTLSLKDCAAIFVYQFGNCDAAGDGEILTLTSHPSCQKEETQEATAMLKRPT